ncbi:MAG: IS4 family transposase, partial [Bacteroidia bacterium]|nr:IS4 family transposase [Bacteroidia bacterium]
STLVSLCMEVFDWAKYRQAKGAIKIHTVLDYDGLLPVFAVVTEGKTHDVIAARGISFPSGSVLLMDRGYLDYGLFFDLDSSGVFFVTRTKTSTAYTVLESREIPPNVKNITDDLTVKLSGQQAAKKYGKPLRVVRFEDPDTGKTLEFITNNFVWAASTIAMLYKQRWMIEIFFKQLKQHLKIKSFVGISENAVMIQIWTAMIAILLLKYLQLRSKYAWNMSNLVASIRINLLVKIGLWNWLDDPFAGKAEEGPPIMQFSLF